MSLYADKLLAYANRTGGIGLIPPGYGRGRLRDYLSGSLSAMVARFEADPGMDGLWKHQAEALSAIARRVADANRAASGLVVIPTGGGKTEIFQRMGDAVSRVAKDGRRVTPNTIVLVPTLNLIEQTASRFASRFPHLSEQVGLIGSDIARDLSGARGVRPITVMSYEGFVRSALGGSIGVEDVHLLLMDEAHRALSDLRRDVFQPFIDECATVAFSATPSFSETKSLHDMFGAGGEIINIPAQRLRDDRVIAPAVNYVVNVRIKGQMPPDPDMARRLKRSAIVQAMREFRRDHVDPETGIRLSDKPMLGFLADRSHSEMARDAINADLAPGIAPVEVITGFDDADDQARKLAALRDGTLAGLLNTRLLGEGSDIPEVGAVFMAPTTSGLQVAQVGGRAIRFDPRWPKDDPRQTAYIVNTVLEVNGVRSGNPVPYWKVIDDYSIARTVEMDPVDVADIDILPETGAPRSESGPDDVIHEEESQTPEASPQGGPAEERGTAPQGPVSGAPGLDDGVQEESSPQAPDPIPSHPGVEHSILMRRNLYRQSIEATRHEQRHPGWTTATGMTRFLKHVVGKAEAEARLDELGSACPATGERFVARIGDLSVAMRSIPGPDGRVVLFEEASAPAIARLIDGASEPITDEWVVRSHVGKNKWKHPDMARFLDTIDAAFLEHRRSGELRPFMWSSALVLTNKNASQPNRVVPIPPVTIRMDVRRGPKGRFLCYHRDSLDALMRVMGQAADTPPKPRGWLSRKEAEAALGGRSRASDAFFRDIEREYEGLERAGVGAATIRRGGHEIEVARMSSNRTSKPVCYAESSLGAMRAARGILPRAPDKLASDLSLKELTARVRTNLSPGSPLQKIRDEVMEMHRAGRPVILDGIPIKVGVKRNSMREEFYWDESCVRIVAESIARRRLAAAGRQPQVPSLEAEHEPDPCPTPGP